MFFPISSFTQIDFFSFNLKQSCIPTGAYMRPWMSWNLTSINPNLNQVFVSKAPKLQNKSGFERRRRQSELMNCFLQSPPRSSRNIIPLPITPLFGAEIGRGQWLCCCYWCPRLHKNVHRGNSREMRDLNPCCTARLLWMQGNASRDLIFFSWPSSLQEPRLLHLIKSSLKITTPKMIRQAPAARRVATLYLVLWGGFKEQCIQGQGPKGHIC